MKASLVSNFSIDRKDKKIRVEREFAAPLEKVWAAWTDNELLDRWWAPKPWKSITKTMKFKEGGYWHYAMVGPDGTEQYARADYITIIPLEEFRVQDSFTDATGNLDKNSPTAIWRVRFSETVNSTLVHIEIDFKDVADLDKLIEMDFKEGFTSGLQNLDELLSDNTVEF